MINLPAFVSLLSPGPLERKKKVILEDVFRITNKSVVTTALLHRCAPPLPEKENKKNHLLTFFCSVNI